MTLIKFFVIPSFQYFLKASGMRCSGFLRELLISFSLLLLASTTLLAAPYGPEGETFLWKQPDGINVKLKAFGDEFYARAETGEGYTVILDRTDNTYYYAKLSKDGQSFIATKYRADGPPPANLRKKSNFPGKQSMPKHLSAARPWFPIKKRNGRIACKQHARGVNSEPKGRKSIKKHSKLLVPKVNRSSH